MTDSFSSLSSPLNLNERPPVHTSTPLCSENPQSISISKQKNSPTGLHREQAIISQTALDNIHKLNQDFCILGLIDFVDNEVNIEKTIEYSRKLIENYKKLAESNHDLNEKLNTIEQNHDLTIKGEDSFKQQIEHITKEKQRFLDENKQHRQKINELNQVVQQNQKEIRRLTNLYSQHESMYKHQYKTLERQMFKLKDRLNTDNPNTSSTIDLSWSLQVEEKLQQSLSKQREYLLQKIIHDFDQKHRLFMLENEQLRQCLVDIEKRLTKIVNIANNNYVLQQKSSKLNDTWTADNNEIAINIEDDELFENNLQNLPCDAINEIVRNHFETLYHQLEKLLSTKQQLYEPETRTEEEICTDNNSHRINDANFLSNISSLNSPFDRPNHVLNGKNKYSIDKERIRLENDKRLLLIMMNDFQQQREVVSSMRWEFEWSKRTQPLPKLPEGFAHKLSKNYYYDRDARRLVTPPQVLFTAHQMLTTGAAQQNLLTDSAQKAQASLASSSSTTQSTPASAGTATIPEAVKNTQTSGLRTPGNLFNWDQ
ncbi:unnamed protein product [Didymodactylos carnosus]|uniref:NADH dehydrogenase [ubiquinone] 1 alpha subcomplex subunit 7 n=1 Tax=Didymodactylos carnosus TaxID=1234261 RepID=A0A8S2IQC8_9BILA|nr:unnamed protein product [Didymodactylos carnosus]CAF3764751.1 unnamed protein product [Didymodactylos carnosus]